MKNTKTILCLALVGSLFVSGIADAKFRSGGSSFSRSSSSFKSSGSSKSFYNRKSTTSTKPATTTATKPKYTSGSKTPSASKPKTTTTTSKQKATTLSSPKVGPAKKTAMTGTARFDRATSSKWKQQKAATSKQTYQARQSQFKKKPATASGATTTSARRTAYAKSPVFSQTKRYGNYGHDDYYRNRDSYYRNTGWNAPSYVYSSHSSFDMWDAMILWSILDRPSSHGMGYHHQNDPGYQEWREEAEILAQTNEEVKQKLDALDESIQEMEQKGVQRDPGYLPEGVPVDVALSAEAMAAVPLSEPSIKVATGVTGGNYSRFGTLFEDSVSNVEVALQPTAGSLANLKLLQSGEVDAAIVQSDTFGVLQSFNAGVKPVDALQASLFSEYALLLVHEDSGVKSAEDLDASHTLYVGPKDSGASMTWRGFGMANSDYNRVKTEFTDYDAAFKAVNDDPSKAAFIVIAPDSPLLKTAGRYANLKLASVPDDFSSVLDGDGNQMYDTMWIEQEAFPNLLEKDLQTVSVDAVWVVRTDWPNAFGESALDTVNYGLADTVASLNFSEVETSHVSSSTWVWIAIVAIVLLGVCVLFVPMFSGKKESYGSPTY